MHEIETILGPRRFTRRQGEALHPDREPLEVLDRIRRTIGEYKTWQDNLEALLRRVARDYDEVANDLEAGAT